MEVEKTFGLRITDAEANKLGTVGSLYDLIDRQIAADQSSPTKGPYSGELWERYLDVVERETGVKRDRLRPEARFVQDLGLD